MSHDWSNRHYATIPYPPDPAIWPLVMERDATCRKSLDGSLVVVKWVGATPAPLAGVTVYDHAAALTIMATPAWSEGPPVP
jgi:hypothetical protein